MAPSQSNDYHAIVTLLPSPRLMSRSRNKKRRKRYYIPLRRNKVCHVECIEQRTPSEKEGLSAPHLLATTPRNKVFFHPKHHELSPFIGFSELLSCQLSSI